MSSARLHVHSLSPNPEPPDPQLRAFPGIHEQTALVPPTHMLSTSPLISAQFHAASCHVMLTARGTHAVDSPFSPQGFPETTEAVERCPGLGKYSVHQCGRANPPRAHAPPTGQEPKVNSCQPSVLWMENSEASWSGDLSRSKTPLSTAAISTMCL